MKKLFFFALSCLFMAVNAQTGKQLPKEFDKEKAREVAKKKGVPDRVMDEYVDGMERKFNEQHNHKANEPKRELVTIAEVGTNRIINQSIHTTQCQNSDWSMNNYSNWTGDIATSCSPGTLYPVATYSNTGINGNNGSIIQLNNSPCNNTTGFQVIHNQPIGALTTVQTSAFANGYDDNCKNPSTGFYDLSLTPSNGVNSIRLSSAYNNYTCAKLRYQLTVNSSNAQFTYQFAVVIDDGFHPQGEQPSFLFGIHDINGNLISGVNQNCVQYNIDASGASNDTSYIQSSLPCSGGTVYYRKWHTVTIDLTSQIGNTVYADFEALDCPWSGHYAYAYISANCGNLTASVSGFCGGQGSATMQAPGGFASYQWYGPNNLNPIAGATSSVYTANPAQNGDVFTVDCITLQGCTTKLQVTVSASNILASGASSPTCLGGSTGSASVTVTGGTQYSYSWIPGSYTTSTISNQQAGNYNVTVHDLTGNCPDTTLTINIPQILPPLQYATDTVCGSTAVINGPGPGTNYSWYNSSGTVVGSTTNYTVTNPSTGDAYTVVYQNSVTGCRDSIKTTLTVNTINFVPISTPPCTGGNTGTIILSASSGNSFSSYSYGVSSTNTLSVAYPTSTTGTISLPAVSAGTYTILVTEPGNPTCAFVYTVTLTGTGIPPAVLDTLKGCALDTLALMPTVAPGSTHSWYNSSGTALGSSYPYNVTPVTANAVYTDTIRNAQGCKSVYKVTLKLKSFNAIITSPEGIHCHNDSTGKLKTTANSEINGPLGTNYVFTWAYPSPYQSQAPGPITAGVGVPQSSTVTNLHAGTYTCYIKSGNCVATKTYTLINPNLPPHDSLFAYFCPKDSMIWLYAEPGHPKYTWVHGGVVIAGYNNDSIQVFTPPDDIHDYYVYYTVAGCKDTADMLFTYPSYHALRPDKTVNIFTPNDDKKNDFFFPFYDANNTPYQIEKQMEDYELVIYNRWGKKLFESTAYAHGWDGREATDNMPDGTYYWICRYRSNCSTKADVIEKHGYVQLIR